MVFRIIFVRIRVLLNQMIYIVQFAHAYITWISDYYRMKYS